MNYNDPIAKNQGAVKASEIFTDDAIALIGSVVGESAIKVIEQMVKVSRDAVSRQNYILRSNSGQVMTWTGTQIRFDANSLANSATFDILQTDDATSRTVSLRFQGSTTLNDTTHFLSLGLTDGDLLYIELDYSQLASGSVIIENAVSGGSLVSGKTLKKVSTVSSSLGMPQLVNPISGTSTTLYIPLALCKGTDIFWIPHGIMWPANTVSPLGAIVQQGFTAWPNFFAFNEATLITAISQANIAGGGIVLITAPFNFTSTVTVPSNVKLLGRGFGVNKITMFNGSGFAMASNSEIIGLFLEAQSSFVGTMITTAGSTRAYVRDTRLNLATATNTTAAVVGISVQASYFRCYNCKIDGVASTSRIGVNFVSGTDNALIDNLYT